MKRRRYFIAVLLLFVFGGLCLLVFGPANRPDPIYNGKPLSEWLEGFDPIPNGGIINPRLSPKPVVTYGGTFVTGSGLRAIPTVPEWLAADEALKHFGTNALSTITWMLNARDPAWRLQFLLLLRKQHVVPIRYTYASHWNRVAITALDNLGSSAEPAMPDMIRAYNNSLSNVAQAVDHDYPAEYLALTVPQLLGKMGPAARGAIPSLLQGAASTNANVRWVAVTALGQIHSDSATVVPFLVKLLKDPDPIVRQNGLQALGEFGKDAESCVPVIVGMLDDRDNRVRSAALHTLSKLHVNPGVTIPALVKALENSRDDHDRFDIMMTLQTFAADAKPAVPAMIEALKRTTNKNLRSNMSEIIEDIQPRALFREGIR
jgi:hypothetical protein